MTHIEQKTQALIDAAEDVLLAHPTFRLKPVGAPWSEERARQDAAIEAEDRLRAAITAAREPGLPTFDYARTRPNRISP